MEGSQKCALKVSTWLCVHQHVPDALAATLRCDSKASRLPCSLASSIGPRIVHNRWQIPRRSCPLHWPCQGPRRTPKLVLECFPSDYSRCAARKSDLRLGDSTQGRRVDMESGKVSKMTTNREAALASRIFGSHCWYCMSIFASWSSSGPCCA
jgi:hypothetical protein